MDFSFIDNKNIAIEERFDIFVSQISAVIGKLFLMKTKAINQNNPIKKNWFTEDLKKERDFYNFLREVYNNVPTKNLKKIISAKTQSYRRILHNAKNRSNDIYLKESNKLQKVMGNLIKNRNNNKNKADSYEFTADTLNEYFTTATQNLIEPRDTSTNYLKFLTDNNDTESFNFSQVSFVEISDAITTFKKSHILDVPGVSLREVVGYILETIDSKTFENFFHHKIAGNYLQVCGMVARGLN